MPSTQRAITIVIGMHRSGTSLVSGLLSALGRDMTDEISPNDSNPHGHWERWELVGFHDRVLAMFDRAFVGPNHAQPLPMGWWADPAVRRIRDEMAAWLEGRMGRSARFGFKDPRATRLLPMWREVFADLGLTPHFLFCLRLPGAVADSLAARDGFARADGERRWLAYNVDGVNGVGGDPVAILPFERWFTDPQSNLRAIAGLLGELDGDDPWLQRILHHVVDKTACHHDPASAPASGLASWLHGKLLEAAAGNAFGPELRTAAAALDGFADVMVPVEAERTELRTAVAALTAELAEARARIAALLAPSPPLVPEQDTAKAAE
jgi:hypothetical protein